ncbi:hypothetical protein H0A66_05595 [Alcaligenaceae bacterium]|nr:hypothetical protein [Alcaligenaceae bacterium]
MKKILCGLVIFLLASATLAHQAVVLSSAQGAAQAGQAFLTHYRDQCHAIMPMHVAQQAGAHGLLREGKQQIFGEYASVVDLADDISISSVAALNSENSRASLRAFSSTSAAD